ncbi:MAG: YqjK-like family protein [Rhodocyclaceae bacterium]
MHKKEVELALKRGRLQERIAAQRVALAAQVVPIAGALATADRAVALGRSGVAYIRTHPLQVGAAFALLAILRPRRVWRWSRRAFIAWGAWRKLRARIEASGLLGRQQSGAA